MSNLLSKSLTELRDGLRGKEFTSAELTQAHIEVIEKTNPHYNSFITITAEHALDMAKACDAKIASGDAGAIEGIPIGVKDSFCTKGVLSTAGSHILDGFIPPYESTVTDKCWQAGGVLIGKLNQDEFAMGSANLNSYYGPVKNPWKKQGSDEDLVPGGSSGGSAAAVAAHQCVVALGTDTGGSVRQPAAYCGVVGVKPTYGRASRWGMIAYASSLDQAGVVARNVRDSAVMLNVICGHDPKDSTSSKRDVPDFEALLDGDIKGKKIGIPKEYRPDGLSDEITAMWDKAAKLLEEAGAQVVEISLPNTKYALASYYIIAPAECSSNLSRYDGVRYGLRETVSGGGLDDMYSQTRAKGFGKEVKRRIMVGTYALSAGYYDAYYKKAQRVRYLVRQDFLKAYEQVDAILTPTAPSAAFSFDYAPTDPVQMYLNDIFTVPTSLAGLPGISLPGGLSKEGLPLGLQLIGKPYEETELLNLALALEKAIGFNAKPQGVGMEFAA